MARLAGCPGAAESAAVRDGSLVRALLGATLLQLPDCMAEASDVLRFWQVKAEAAAGLRSLVAGVLLEAPGGAPRLTGAGAWDEVLRAAPSLLRESVAELAAHRRRRQEEGADGAVVGGSSTRSGCIGSGNCGTGNSGSSSGGSSSGGSEHGGSEKGGSEHGVDSPNSIAELTAHAAHELCAAMCSIVALVLLVNTQEPEGSSSRSSCGSSCTGPVAPPRPLEELRAAVAGVCGCGRLTSQALLALAMVEAASTKEAAAASGDTAAGQKLRPLLACLLADARRLAGAQQPAPREGDAPDTSGPRGPQSEDRASPSQLSSGTGRGSSGSRGGDAGASQRPPTPDETVLRIGCAALTAAVQRPAAGDGGGAGLVCSVCVGRSDGSCNTLDVPPIDAALRALYAAPQTAEHCASLAATLVGVAGVRAKLGEMPREDRWFEAPASLATLNAAGAAAPAVGPTQECLAPRAPRSGRTRGCAYCGRTSAQGAALRRCAGCGALTGVRYCSQACCRNHWVRTGHRQQCEEAQRELREQNVQQQPRQQQQQQQQQRPACQKPQQH
ncbi:hypothetical protein MNEG_0060 [Monoraphidium neglectum]|uniref:MYND-type domain-containing protein n=1 Tax=Monoraphidium neglectum TaxID=145388 RepID=A0A0D2MZP2_9CHLO|nr:hypothetical protein MNEG_0060 [Monoraphidium neglectum]KIZ07905.1 hypothetical protein MNEG_0060 [Monoraphidium neglectum]|eukprot:XP_013906924.1 hypothetical protein MNEG_0060 [Monoraphidium neglectum]